MAAIYPILMNAYKKSNTNIDELFITLILITLPLGGYAINSSVVIIYFSFNLIRYFTDKPKIPFQKTPILFVVFYFLCILSLFWTDSLKNTADGLVRFLSYLVIPLTFILNSKKIVDKNKILDYFAKVMVLFALYCMVFGAIKAIKNKDVNFLFYHELSGNFGELNAIYLSIFCSLALGVFLFKTKKSKTTLLYTFILSIFLILLSSKIIISITFLYGLLYFFRKNILKKVKPIHFITLLIAAFILLISSINFMNRFKTEFEKTKITEVLKTKDFGHVYLWTGVGLRVFQTKAFFEILSEKERLILGSGLNNSQKDLNDKYQEYNLYPGFLDYNFHNQYLQVFAELGLIGFLLLLFILYIVLYNSIIEKDYFALFFIILVATVCITESFLWRQRGMIFFITITLLINQKLKEANS